MSFLALNGLPFPVAVSSLAHRVEEVGEARRAIDGTLAINRRALKNVFEFQTPPRPVQEALFLRDVVLGNGDVWPFNASHLYSSKGRPGSTGSSYTWTGTGKWGGTALTLSSTQYMGFPLTMAHGATVFLWQTQNSGTTWYLEAATFGPTGTRLATWRVTTAGVVTVGSPLASSWTGTSSDVTFFPGSGTTWVSDVWAVHRSTTGIASATIETEWLPALAQVVAARSASPKLLLTGDFVDPSVATAPSLTVRGEAGAGAVLPVWRSGAFSKTEHTLQVTLTEV